MIEHIVMYKLKDRTKENAQILQEKFLSMKGKIDVLKDIKAGVDFLTSPRSYDVVLQCKFDTKEDMQTYSQHPVHLPIMAYVKSVVDESHSVDYEL
ncbi:MAG: Dabb family protein [Clostridia bacterium]